VDEDDNDEVYNDEKIEEAKDGRLRGRGRGRGRVGKGRGRGIRGRASRGGRVANKQLVTTRKSKRKRLGTSPVRSPKKTRRGSST